MRRYALSVFLLVILFPSLLTASASVRKLPSFSLYTLRGEEIPFSPKTPAILFFLTPGCFSCLLELSSLLRGLESSGKAISLYPVCLRCDFRDVRNLEESFGGRLTIYLAHPELPALLGIWETPAIFLVNEEGRVLYQEKGKVSWEVLRSLFPSEAKHRSPKEEQITCTLGFCS